MGLCDCLNRLSCRLQTILKKSSQRVSNSDTRKIIKRCIKEQLQKIFLFIREMNEPVMVIQGTLLTSNYKYRVFEFTFVETDLYL